MTALSPTLRCALAAVAVGVSVTLIAGCGSSRSGTSSDGTATTASDSLVDASACPTDATTPLAAGAPIKIGLTLPLSGPLAPVAALVQAGAQTVVDTTNADGGVSGHPLQLVVRDNGFDPAREVTNTQEFIGQEQVFAVENQVTTSMIKAAQPLLVASCTPQVNAITTNLEMGDAKANPWTILGIPPADAEASALATWIAQTKPGARVLEVRQDNELGSDFALSFPARATAAGLTVLPAQTVSPVATTYDPQIAALVTSGADAVFAEIQGPACSAFLKGLARAGWNGLTAVSSACNGAKQYFIPIGSDGDGVVAPFFTVDPGDPANASDPRLADYFAAMARYQPNADAAASNALDGYSGMQMLVAALTRAAASDAGLTRVSLMESLWHLTLDRPQFLKPEQTIDGAADPYVIDHLQLRRYDSAKGGWQDTGVSDDYVRP